MRYVLVVIGLAMLFGIVIPAFVGFVSWYIDSRRESSDTGYWLSTQWAEEDPEHFQQPFCRAMSDGYLSRGEWQSIRELRDSLDFSKAKAKAQQAAEGCR